MRALRALHVLSLASLLLAATAGDASAKSHRRQDCRGPGATWNADAGRCFRRPVTTPAREAPAAVVKRVLLQAFAAEIAQDPPLKNYLDQEWMPQRTEFPYKTARALFDQAGGGSAGEKRLTDYLADPATRESFARQTGIADYIAARRKEREDAELARQRQQAAEEEARKKAQAEEERRKQEEAEQQRRRKELASEAPPPGCFDYPDIPYCQDWKDAVARVEREREEARKKEEEEIERHAQAVILSADTNAVANLPFQMRVRTRPPTLRGLVLAWPSGEEVDFTFEADRQSWLAKVKPIWGTVVFRVYPKGPARDDSSKTVPYRTAGNTVQITAAPNPAAEPQVVKDALTGVFGYEVSTYPPLRDFLVDERQPPFKEALRDMRARAERRTPEGIWLYLEQPDVRKRYLDKLGIAAEIAWLEIVRKANLEVVGWLPDSERWKRDAGRLRRGEVDEPHLRAELDASKSYTNGCALVFVHGLADSGDMWTRTIEGGPLKGEDTSFQRLKGRFGVHRDTFRSPDGTRYDSTNLDFNQQADQLKNWVDAALGVVRPKSGPVTRHTRYAVLIGHSMGGLAALRYAERNPGMAAAVITMDAPLIGSPAPAIAEGVAAAGGVLATGCLISNPATCLLGGILTGVSSTAAPLGAKAMAYLKPGSPQIQELGRELVQLRGTVTHVHSIVVGSDRLFTLGGFVDGDGVVPAHNQSVLNLKGEAEKQRWVSGAIELAGNQLSQVRVHEQDWFYSTTYTLKGRGSYLDPFKAIFHRDAVHSPEVKKAVDRALESSPICDSCGTCKAGRGVQALPMDDVRQKAVDPVVFDLKGAAEDVAARRPRLRVSVAGLGRPPTREQLKQFRLHVLCSPGDKSCGAPEPSQVTTDAATGLTRLEFPNVIADARDVKSVKLTALLQTSYKTTDGKDVVFRSAPQEAALPPVASKEPPKPAPAPPAPPPVAERPAPPAGSPPQKPGSEKPGGQKAEDQKPGDRRRVDPPRISTQPALPPEQPPAAPGAKPCDPKLPRVWQPGCVPGAPQPVPPVVSRAPTTPRSEEIRPQAPSTSTTPAAGLPIEGARKALLDAFAPEVQKYPALRNFLVDQQQPPLAAALQDVRTRFNGDAEPFARWLQRPEVKGQYLEKHGIAQKIAELQKLSSVPPTPAPSTSPPPAWTPPTSAPPAWTPPPSAPPAPAPPAAAPACDPAIPRYAQPGCREAGVAGSPPPGAPSPPPGAAAPPPPRSAAPPVTPVPSAKPAPGASAPAKCNPGIPRYAQPGCVE